MIKYPFVVLYAKHGGVRFQLRRMVCCRGLIETGMFKVVRCSFKQVQFAGLLFLLTFKQVQLAAETLRTLIFAYIHVCGIQSGKMVLGCSIKN